jgi:4-alpha-glucanotransferase
MPKLSASGKALKRTAGVLVPLFSVYSEKSPHIGDLSCIRQLVDWCEKCGISILQLLPMNETGPTSCPYDSISSFALEPVYAAPCRGSRAAGQASVPAKRTHVDYRVKEEKLKALRKTYDKSVKDLSGGGFKEFCAGNAYWLDDFSIYKAVKETHGGTPWYEWGAAYRDRDAATLKEFAAGHAAEIKFHKWTQWTLFRQFLEAKEYANSKGVFLKGDLPILVSRDSADVWAHPYFFKLEYAAGAPPDMYCAKGQRWGAPTYNWGNIEADGFTYIKEKLKYAENFYDMLRIDHVVGLFRVWSIPYDEPAENHGLNGFFDPADENAWGARGGKLLSILQDNTRMILCAEDLGVIPKACRETLKEMKIPGNDVQRWTKDWGAAHDFLPPDKYRRLSVAMLSTHDTTSWAGWWENEAGTVDEALFVRKCKERGIDFAAVQARLFDSARSRHGRLRWREQIVSTDMYVGILGKRPEELKDFIELYENSYLEKEKLWKQLKMKGALREVSSAGLVRAALGVTASSESVYDIELIFDLLSAVSLIKGDPYDIRVNAPGTVSAKNWSLKVPLPLEALVEHEANAEIRRIFAAGGRT